MSVIDVVHPNGDEWGLVAPTISGGYVHRWTNVGTSFIVRTSGGSAWQWPDRAHGEAWEPWLDRCVEWLRREFPNSKVKAYGREFAALQPA